MRSGVREGSVISPLLFRLYIDDLIKILRSAGYGCYLRKCVYWLLAVRRTYIVIVSISDTTTVKVMCGHQYCIVA